MCFNDGRRPEREGVDARLSHATARPGSREGGDKERRQRRRQCASAG